MPFERLKGKTHKNRKYFQIIANSIKSFYKSSTKREVEGEKLGSLLVDQSGAEETARLKGQ